MKTSLKFGLFSFVVVFCLSVVYASTDISTYFEQQRSAVMHSYQDVYQRVYSGFLDAVAPLKVGYSYQALQCLGVSSESQFLALMQAEMKQTTVNFLNSYTALYADFFSSSDYSGAVAQITALSAQHSGFMSQFESNYTNKTHQFVQDIQGYLVKNAPLLSGLVYKMQLLDTLSQRYQSLLSSIIDFQSRVAGSNAVFFDRLPLVKSGALDVLDANISTTIIRQVTTYPILKSLSGELAQQKLYAKSLFALQFDEDVALLFSGWYDSKQLLSIKKDMEKLIALYQPGGNYSCSPLLTATGFSQDVSSLLARIDSVAKSFQSTGDVLGGRSFTGYITQRSLILEQDRKKHEQLFTTAMRDITNRLLSEYKQLNGQLTGQILTGLIPQVQPSVQGIPSYVFVRAFSLNQKHGDILVLQKLLTRLGYYTGAINSIYTKQTKNAIYQFQLAKGLLKGYEKRPQTWGWMGPATRKALTNEMIQ